MAEKVVVWDDWSGGEYGDIPDHHAAPNQFTGMNVVVYRNGEIGPRPGIRSFTNDSLGHGFITGAGFAGTAGADHWVMVNKALSTDVEIYDGTGGSTWVVHSGAITTPSVGLDVTSFEEVDSATTYVLVPTNKLYRFDHVDGGSTITPLTFTDPDGHAIAKYRDRLYGNSGNTVYYSEANDADTWDSSDFFKVGVGPPVRWMGTQRDSLIIITSDSRVYQYTGSPGSDTLREIYTGTRHPWVFYPGQARVLPDGNLLFVPVDRDYPAWLTGGRVVEMDHLSILGGPDYSSADSSSEVGIYRLDEDDEALILFEQDHPTSGQQRAITYRDGKWFFFEWGVANISTLASTDGQEVVLLNDGGGTDPTVATFYTYNPKLERPAFTSDTYSQPGDNTDTPLDAYFKTGEWWAPEGQEVTVKNIIVDFTKYDTGAGVQNHFDVGVIRIAQHADDTSETAIAYQAFDEDDDSANTTGIRDRHISGGPSGGTIPSAGFQIYIEGIVGCTIKGIRVIIDQNPATPRY